MKITDLKMIHIRPRWMFLKIETDEGICGWGEPVVEGRARTVETAVNEFRPMLIGADPLKIEHLWQGMYRRTFYRGGPILCSAISGIEMALWDIKGKYYNMPVFEMLGGAYRDKVRMYGHLKPTGHPGDFPIPEMLKITDKRLADGFTVMKYSIIPPIRPIDNMEMVDKVVERCNGDATAILNDPGDDVVWSGPYTKYYSDDQKVVLIRDDNYWGQDASMWGKLPVPKYLVHVIYADNAAGEVALKAGEVDVCQQFIGNIQNLWLEDGLPISTFYDEAPYGVCLTMPTAWYNMNLPVIAENTALRKAIAMAVDYDTIIANAMTNQSPSFSDVPRSLMNPTDGEQALYDHDAVADLQWAGNDIEGAKALLDEAGIVDSDGDGWREWNGEKISLNAVCPNGWTDWQASMEVVAAAGKNIGVEITTLYPEYSIYQTVFVDPDQTEYAIFMWSPDASTPSNPWGRVNQFMGKDYVGIANNWSGNWGQYVNDEAEALIKKIPTTTDTAELKDLYTKLTEIYLTEVPSFSLMYRPSVFHCVNESVWTNFPAGDDGRNIPPADCTDGYGIAALYELELVG